MTHRLGRATLGCALAFLVSACASPSSSPASSASDEPSATATTPTPEASAAPSLSSDEASASPAESQGADGAFTVTPNPDADALFLDRDECTNETDGYRLAFPEAWYTNTAVGDVEPCRWFSPTTYTVDDPRDVPAEIAITVEYLTGDRGSFEEAISREFGIVGETQQAVRVEYRGAAGNGGEMPPEWREYVYLVQLGPTEEGGPNLLVRTSTDMGGDYELNKAVLDRIMATIEFIGTIES
jgi:hypothetical protein